MADDKWLDIADKVWKLQQSKKILLLISGGNCYSGEILEILSQWQNVSMNYIISKHGSIVHREEQLLRLATKLNSAHKVFSSVQEADLIFLPFMTRNSLAKASLGIADDMLTTALSQALMLEKKVIALDCCINPETEQNRLKKLNQNKPYLIMLKQHQRNLEDFGMKFIPIYELEPWMDAFFKDKNLASSSHTLEESNTSILRLNKNTDQIITLNELSGVASLTISKDTKFTDLAKEYVAEHNIEVRYSEE